MKTFLSFFFFFYIGFCSAQSDWLMKPYVFVNDTLYEDLKLPVFIMDSTLYIRTSNGTVLTFPSRDVDYISKRCFYKKIGDAKKSRLAKSGNTIGYLSAFTSIVVIRNAVKDYLINPTYYANPTGLFLLIPTSLIIKSLITRKLIMKMIVESKGLRKIPRNEPSILLEDIQME
jgi:hypothetical protein